MNFGSYKNRIPEDLDLGRRSRLGFLEGGFMF